MSFLKKVVPVALFGILLILVIFKTEPPASFTSASPWQLSSFLITLLIFFTFLVDIYVKFLLKSFVISLGLIILVTLKGLEIFNIVSVTLTFGAVILIVRSLKKPKFVIPQKIPKFSRTLKQR